MDFLRNFGFTALTGLALAIWVGLIGFRDRFWTTAWQLEDGEDLSVYPAICAVIPARNEAEVLPTTLRSLFEQDYPGPLRIVVVDDRSSDGTAAIAVQVAAENSQEKRELTVLAGEPLPSGWTGKLWALEQGITVACQGDAPDYILLSDADIEHDRTNLRRLVAKALGDNRELVSLMVKLRCESFWERLLIPPFVFFFQKLYPFGAVNNPGRSLGAAAGGCILLKREALERIGGIGAIREALIDDCALAQAIKSSGEGRIWLGLSVTTCSLRVYDSLSSIWEMVARTAFTQLHYSVWLLLGTAIAMSLIYLIPPLGFIVGWITGNFWAGSLGLAGWLLMAGAYWPMVRFYGLSPLWALTLPLVALLYTLMTVDSALRHWQGRGGSWKGRVYSLKN